MQRFWATDGHRKCTVFLFYLSSHYHIYIFKSLCPSRADYFENLRETNVLACKMFTSGCCPWLKNVVCSLITSLSAIFDAGNVTWPSLVFELKLRPRGTRDSDFVSRARKSRIFNPDPRALLFRAWLKVMRSHMIRGSGDENEQWEQQSDHPLVFFSGALGLVLMYIDGQLGLRRRHNRSIVLAILHGIQFSMITLHIL